MQIAMQTGMRTAALVGVLLTATGASAVRGDETPAAPGVMTTFVTAGAIDPNGKVPAVNAVPGSGVPNLDIAAPLAILQHGSAYVYLLASQNTTFSGTCKDTYELTQIQGGKKVVLDSGVMKSAYTCDAGQFWSWAIVGKAVPDAPGLATLTGTVTYGTKKISTKLAVLIQ